MGNGTIYETDGQGFDEPILEKGKNLCLFEIGDAYIIRKRKHGEIKKLPKNEDTINELLKNGWTWVNYMNNNGKL
jgi:hypothetical protein